MCIWHTCMCNIHTCMYACRGQLSGRRRICMYVESFSICMYVHMAYMHVHTYMRDVHAWVHTAHAYRVYMCIPTCTSTNTHFCAPWMPIVLLLAHVMTVTVTLFVYSSYNTIIGARDDCNRDLIRLQLHPISHVCLSCAEIPCLPRVQGEIWRHQHPLWLSCWHSGCVCRWERLFPAAQSVNQMLVKLFRVSQVFFKLNYASLGTMISAREQRC